MALSINEAHEPTMFNYDWAKEHDTIPIAINAFCLHALSV